MDKMKFEPNNDISTLLVYSATGDDVITTIVDGQVLMEDRKLLLSDEKQAIQKVNENARRLLH
jgi:5-methylthioadenosine/S-adenosylhomocysteine deaminase